MQKLLFCFLFLGLIVCSIFGQSGREDFKLIPRYSVEHGQCELRGSYLHELKTRRKTGEFVIVISHLGKEENAKFSFRRLHNARTFLTTKLLEGGAPLDAVVVAEGETVDEKGYLDFFFRSELFLRVFFRQNTDLTIDRCGFTEEDEDCLYEIEKEVFPCKDRDITTGDTKKQGGLHNRSYKTQTRDSNSKLPPPIKLTKTLM